MRIGKSGGGGSTLVVAETLVFDGNTPNPAAYTDLDLSGVVGANAAVVLLKYVNLTGANPSIWLRRNGDAGLTNGSHCAASFPSPNYSARLFIETDNNGVVEWRCSSVGLRIQFFIEAYIT